MDKFENCLDLALRHNSKYVRFFEIDKRQRDLILTVYLDDGSDEADLEDFLQSLLDCAAVYVVDGLVNLFLLDCKYDQEEKCKQIYVEYKPVNRMVKFTTELWHGREFTFDLYLE